MMLRTGKSSIRRFSLVALAVFAAMALIPSAGASARTKSGGTTPTVSVSFSSVPSSVVCGNSATITGSASASLGLANVSISVDGGAYQAATGTTSWSYTLNTTGIAVGTHTVTARAVDTGGNSKTASASISVTADTTAPTVTITSPLNGATVTGTISVTGQASDNVRVAQVAVSIDGGPYAAATGTTSWSLSLNTSSLSMGSHTITARATDGAGNAGTSSVSVNAPDTTPPTVSIAAPTSGSTVAGTISVSGAASDNVGVTQVALRVDSGSYTTIQGTSSWSATLDSTFLADGTHTLTARATDAAGNVATSSTTINVSNGSMPAGVSQELVTPEGATIEIGSDVTGWTAQQVYNLLKANAYELSMIGPDLTVDVQTQYATVTSTSVSQVSGVYQNYRAIIYLQATSSSVFTTRPDYAVAHEYGHAWATYHLYMTQNGDWSSWLNYRGLTGNPNLNSSLQWDESEMIADDYRMLFGSPAAVSEAAYINPDIPDPRTVPGLQSFLATSWA
jgi:hypothetical protein